MCLVEIICFTGTSGITDYSVSLARELRLHMDVRLVTAEDTPVRYRELGFEVETPFRRTRHLPIDYFRLLRQLLRRQPDAVLVQSWIKWPFVEYGLIRLLKAFGIKTAMTVHDLLPHYPRFWSRFELSHYYRQFDGLVAHSSKTELGLRALGVTAPILVVPHGIYDIFDLDRLDKASARQRLGIALDDFVVLFFGHLESRKGLFEFIETAGLLKGEPGINFVIAGKSSLPSSEETRMTTLAAANRVRLDARRIPIEEVQNYFAAADIVALPYLEGTTSGVLKLAFAFGKPVIATNVGDLSESIAPGMGELIPTHDIPQYLASAVMNMRADYARYVDNGAEFRARFAWSGIASQYADFLMKVVKIDRNT